MTVLSLAWARQAWHGSSGATPPRVVKVVRSEGLLGERAGGAGLLLPQHSAEALCWLLLVGVGGAGLAGAAAGIALRRRAREQLSAMLLRGGECAPGGRGPSGHARTGSGMGRMSNRLSRSWAMGLSSVRSD